MLIGLERNLLAAVHGPGPRPIDRDTAPAERHLTGLVAVTDCAAIGVVLALRAHDIIDLLLHQLAQDAEPDTDAERQQPLLRCPDELPQSLLNTLRQNDLIHGRPSDRYVALHGGSSCLNSPAFTGGAPAALSLLTSTLLISASIPLLAPQHGAVFSPTPRSARQRRRESRRCGRALRKRSARVPFLVVPRPFLRPRTLPSGRAYC
jgi:hypothetical protein